jgi:ELWxxDGT repeat protein
VANSLFFVADDGIHGLELWKSDGTARGTTLVKAHPSRPRRQPAAYLTALGNRLLFAAQDERGNELWASDGTADGTRLVKDIRAGAASSQPSFITAWGDAVYFAATEDARSVQLWKSDGTEQGTIALTNANDTPGGPRPHASRAATAFCSSPPPTRLTATSFGRATAHREAPASSRISSPGRPTRFPTALSSSGRARSSSHSTPMATSGCGSARALR